MPGKVARKEMLKSNFLQFNCLLEDDDFDEVAVLTKGYSGADMRLLCKEAGMRSLRRILKHISDLEPSGRSVRPNKKVNTKLLMRQFPITLEDIKESIINTKASTNPELFEKYTSWAEKYGAM